MAICKHKWIYSRSDSYWRFSGRNSREYYHADYFFCEKCLEEKIIEKPKAIEKGKLLFQP